MTELEVLGMTCGGCERSVKNAVLAVDAAADVTIDRTANRVRIESKLSAEDLKAAIAAAGYEVAVL